MKLCISDNETSQEFFTLAGKDIFADEVFVLNKLEKIPVFVDKKPTAEIAGYDYGVVNRSSYESIRVRVNGAVPAVTEEMLAAAKADGAKIYVKFEKLTICPREIKFKKATLTIKAEAAEMVEMSGKAGK